MGGIVLKRVLFSHPTRRISTHFDSLGSHCCPAGGRRWISLPPKFYQGDFLFEHTSSRFWRR